jgi:ribosomal protein S18 acetylase RimI-like enzyme
LERAVTDGRLAPRQHVWRVVQSGAEVGDVWLMLTRGADAHVVEVDVPEAVAGEAFDALAHAAAGLGVRRLLFSCYPGDRVTDAVLAGRRVELMATQMQLTLDAPPPESRVRLEPMGPERYDEFLRHELEHYAQEMLAAGSHTDLEAAQADSRRQHDQLLPDGVATPGQFLWTACDVDREVGILWINVAGDRAFIYDIEVDESCRRQGYGGAILRAGAHAAVEHEAAVLGLNVFGPNEGARALYEKTGFATIERALVVDL